MSKRDKIIISKINILVKNMMTNIYINIGSSKYLLMRIRTLKIYNAYIIQ